MTAGGCRGPRPVRERDGLPADWEAASEPFAVRGLVLHWPAVAAAREGDGALLAYLRRLRADKNILAFEGSAGHGGRYFYNDRLDGFNFTRLTLGLGELLDRLEELAASGGKHCYVGSSTVADYFPGFAAENPPAVTAPGALASLWMGNESRIAAHFDAPDNLACVIGGRRRFTLFPPEQLPKLYVGPLDFTPAGQAVSMVDVAQPDFDRHPAFREALAAAQVAELEPGDALFVPSMWWHHVEGLAPLNVMINYWWRDGAEAAGNPFNALLHALLSIRGLPARQRVAWRGLFEHYVFDPEANPGHLPPERLGILGALDPPLRKQLRALLRKAM